jgi:Stage II sporulation protein E (SpoIIE)
MMFRPFFLALILVLTSGCFAEPSLQEPATVPSPTGETRQAVTVVNGPWRFHVGDDARWADPGFDDTTWETYTIDPGHASLTVPEVLKAAPLPGWQAHGHPRYFGYAWYRISIDPASDRSNLAILMPPYVDDSYQIYVNGKQIGTFGQFGDHGFVYYSRPKLFPIPAGAIPSTGPFTFALRFRASHLYGSTGSSNTSGGLRGVPLLGQAPLLAVCYQAQVSRLTRDLWFGGVFVFLWGGVGLISFFLFVFTRTHREYLWAGISFTGIAVMASCEDAAWLLSLPIQIVFPCRYLATLVGLSTGLICVMYLLDVHKPIWRRLNYLFSAALATGIAISLYAFFSQAPSIAGWGRGITRFALFGGALLALAIAFDGIRTLGAKAWLLLTPALFGGCGLLLELAGGRFYDFSGAVKLLVPVSLLIVFLLRAAQQQRENEQYLLDMRQAQEVQQLLLPERLPQVAGFSIESVYLPAREVGGDFFQVLETRPGSILIVFGDIAGKGLPAAMLVAMLVGAIRTRAKESDIPAEMLSALNNRLCGNTRGGFATCIAVHISADGTVDLANAGHLAPYLNGNEVRLEGALPLGLAPEVEFAAARFSLQPGDGLTFVSDGVVEARNGHRELFGFERLRELSTQKAQRIADTAKRFGQEDDITVLTFRRLAVLADAKLNGHC